MEEFSSESGSELSKIHWFLGSKGNEFFCEVDEDYMQDRFNLTGIASEVQHFQSAFDLVTDVFEEDVNDELRDVVERSARHLYGLIHARYIITQRGLAKMVEKYKKSDFGKCPRVLCNCQMLLPLGLSDVAHVKPVKLYCPRCEDVYTPKSARHAAIDGAYFGASFPHIVLQVHPQLVPVKVEDRYTPRIFGFRINEYSRIHRKQDLLRQLQRQDANQSDIIPQTKEIA